MPPSISFHSASPMRPARFSSQYFQASEPEPSGLPRQCHLYLDARTCWAQRVEWWGPTAGVGDDRLLVQMEFRNPVFNRPLPADVCARLFSFHPGDVPIEDETASVAAEMSRRAGELAAERAAAR